MLALDWSRKTGLGPDPVEGGGLPLVPSRYAEANLQPYYKPGPAKACTSPLTLLR